jgi:hypothetical protein
MHQDLIFQYTENSSTLAHFTKEVNRNKNSSETSTNSHTNLKLPLKDFIDKYTSRKK